MVPVSPAELPTRPAELEAAARAVLDPQLYDYLAGGAGDELGLREAVTAWARWAPRARVLAGCAERSTDVTLLGRAASPVLVAPMAGQAGVHPSGEVGLARAAAAAGSVYVLSTRAAVSPTELARSVPSGRHWLQLYVLQDRSVGEGLVREAAGAGFEAVVLTADAPVLGARDREVGNTYVGPAGPAVGAGIRQDPSLGWRDLEQLVAAAGLPVVLKGVLEPDDAVRAVECGVAAVVVSTHGARQLDTVVPSAVALPEVVAAVDGAVPVLVDGGIRRGTDVLVALALGASAVLVGRPLLWGLAVGGPTGAQRVLERLTDELSIAQALVGVPGATELVGAGERVLRRAHWR